ncbi:MAG: 50S ribosomal protein L18a [Methanomassiliicoccaceae archaeon]|jgi:large subunit ribosomal protein LX|nr:50S ribosomal protein L18a [Methanomassiliicoccaceae archaeon]
MKGFRAKGSFKDKRNRQDFTVEVAAETADAARERVLSNLGSRHKLKRWEISIDEMTELAPADITDRLVQHEVGVNE